MSPRRFSTLATLSLGAMLVVVTSGAFVRAHGLGLGCENWPRCGDTPYPEQGFHAFVEFGNRVVAAIGILFALATWLASRRTPDYRGSPRLAALGAFLGGLAQIPLGGVTVILDLHPLAVMSHFLLALVVVALARRRGGRSLEPRAGARRAGRARAGCGRPSCGSGCRCAPRSSSRAPSPRRPGLIRVRTRTSSGSGSASRRPCTGTCAWRRSSGSACSSSVRCSCEAAPRGPGVFLVWARARRGARWRRRSSARCSTATRCRGASCSCTSCSRPRSGRSSSRRDRALAPPAVLVRRALHERSAPGLRLSRARPRPAQLRVERARRERARRPTRAAAPAPPFIVGGVRHRP